MYTITFNDKKRVTSFNRPDSFIDYIKSVGIPIDAETGGFNITITPESKFNIMDAVSALEEDVCRWSDELETNSNGEFSAWDSRHTYKLIKATKGSTYPETVLDNTLMIYNNSYIFLPLRFIKALKECGVIQENNVISSEHGHRHTFTLIKNVHIEGEIS